MIKKIVLVGRGAVGAVYAAALTDAMNQGVIEKGDFRVAVDTLRAERYRTEGFRFNNKVYDFEYFTPSEKDPVADLVIVATKWGALAHAMDMADPIIGPKTIILPLLNGLSTHRYLSSRYGAQCVLRGFYIGTTASHPSSGQVIQKGIYITNFGKDDGNVEPYTQCVARIKELFDRTGISYRIPPCMIQAQWQKFIINLGTNQPTALYNYNYGELFASKEGMELSTALMREAAAIAEVLRVPGASNMVEKGLASFDNLIRDDYSSTAQDIRAGRPTEIDMFAGEVIRMGRELGVPTPVHEKFMQAFVLRDK